MKKLILLIAISLFVSDAVFAQCYAAGENLPSAGLLRSTSGYTDLDSIVIEEINKLEKFYGVEVDFFFLLEENGMNAMYVPYCNHACKGTICLGLKMLYSELKKTNGLYTTKAILAHEFGHCVQHVIGWSEQWKRPELHADFMAGYYLGENYNHTAKELDVLFNNFYEIGDNNYWSASHHGTGSERECAFREGYCFAKETNVGVDYANSYAIQYVVADKPCAIRKYKAWEQMINNDAEKSKVIVERSKGQSVIKNLATTNSTVKLTFKSNDNLFYDVSAPGIGRLGYVSEGETLTVIVDSNSEYKFTYRQYRRTLFGRPGSIKSDKWTIVIIGGYDKTEVLR
jgi:hypothetical protein